MPIRDREHEQPGAEPEQAGARQRRELDDEQEGEHESERHLQPVPALEPQVERRQHEQRDHELDPEVVRVARECVRPEDAGALDRAVDVDLAGAAGDRREQRLVEVDPEHLGGAELDDPVDGVGDEAGHEDRERRPVEALAPPRQVRDPDDEEAEVEEELEHPLRPLGQRLLRLEVEEADQIDGEEGDEEETGHGSAPGEPAVARADAGAEPGDEKDRGQDVREAERPRDLPLQLREADREDGGEKEELDDEARLGAVRRLDHGSERTSSASSSARARRESR